MLRPAAAAARLAHHQVMEAVAAALGKPYKARAAAAPAPAPAPAT